MASSKPQGIEKKHYQEKQSVKEDEEFKFNTNQGLQNLRFDIEKLQDGLNKLIDQQGSFRVQISGQLESDLTMKESKLSSFRQELGDACTEVKRLNKNMSDLDAQVKERVTMEYFTYHLEDLCSCIEQLNLEISKARIEGNGLIERLKLDFSSQLKQLKEEILAIPSEIPDLRKLLDEKIELVELNSQNVVLRSANNERNILLVERKIENIYQLLKKIDLNRQESQK